MNSTKTSSAESRYSNVPFFKFTLKNNWQHFALYFILLLLAVVLPCVMMINEYNEKIYSAYYDKASAISNILTTCGITSIFSSLVLALFAGMSSASYVNSKQMVGCYHSFPMKRGRLFLVETSVRGIYYLVSFLICSAGTLLLVNAKLEMNADFNLIYLKYTLAAVLCFFLLYSILLFAGGLTGTAPVRLIMTLLLLFLPLVLYALVVENACIGISDLNDSYYLSERVIRVLCSTYRLAEAIAKIDSNIQPELFYNIFWCIPEAVVYYVGALLLHKYRKSESSGTTIIWKPVFLFTKYISMFTAALLGILLFGSNLFRVSSENNTIWIVFGLVFGLAVSFMLINAILYRSSKAIFRGIRGLIAVSAIAVVFMLILPMNVFGIYEKFYTAEKTKSFEIQNNEMTLQFTERDDIETLLPLLDAEYSAEQEEIREAVESGVVLWNDRHAEELSEQFSCTVYGSREDAEQHYPRDFYDFTYRSFDMVTIIQKPTIGIPLSKRISIDNNEKFWNAVCHTDELDTAVEKIREMNPDDVVGMEIHFANSQNYIDLSELSSSEAAFASRDYEFRTTEGGAGYFLKYDSQKIKDILSEILPYCTYDAAERDNGVLVGSITLSISQSLAATQSNVTYPIYADNLTVLNGICEIMNEFYGNSPDYIPVPTEFVSSEQYIEFFVDTYVAAAAIIDRETGEIRNMPLGLLKELAGSFTLLSGNNYHVSEYVNTSPESRYWFTAAFYSGMDESQSVCTLYLRKGAVEDAKLEELFQYSE